MGKNKNKKAVQAAKPIVVSSEEDEEFGDISSGDEAGEISGSGDESGEYSEMFESGEEEMGESESNEEQSPPIADVKKDGAVGQESSSDEQS